MPQTTQPGALEDGHRLLVCLAVAARAHDPVLVTQIAHRADITLTNREIRRTFAKLSHYGVNQNDLNWLRSCGLA